MTRNLGTALVVLLLATAACSSGDSDSGTKAAASTVDAGAKLAASDAGDVTEELDLDEGTFTVAPGEEVTYCVKIPMPAQFKGRELGLMSYSSDIPVPTHHYFLTYSTSSVSGTEPVPCSGTSGVLPQATSGTTLFTSGVLATKILFGAGVGQDTNPGRAGYGRIMEADGSFITNHHVLNVTASPVTMYARFKLQVMDSAKVQHPVRTLICADTGAIDVPAHQSATVTSTCTAPFDLDLVTTAGHAHARLTSFTAQMFDGTATQSAAFYTNTNWDNPTIDLFPGGLMHLKQGQGVTFTCNYMNNTDADISAGFNAGNEMCALFTAYAYPADVTFKAPPPLYGQVPGATPAAASDSTNVDFFF
jgi:hypothetical protein